GSFTTGISYEDKMYIADKREEGAFVYAFNSEKKVKHLRSVSDMSFESVCGMDYNGALYVLLGRHNSALDDNTMCYRVFKFSDGLSPEKYSPVYVLPSGMRASGFSYENGYFYIGAVSDDRMSAGAFSITEGVLSDVDKDNLKQPKSVIMDEDSKALTATNVFVTQTDDGRFFAEAIFKNGTFIPWMDNEEPNEVFVIPNEIKETYYSMDLPLLLRFIIELRNFLILGIASVAILMIFVIMIVTSKGHRTFSLISVGEIIAVLSICIVISFVTHEVSEQVRIDKYKNLYNEISTSALNASSFATIYNTGATPYEDTSYTNLIASVERDTMDVMLTKERDVIASKSGHNFCTIDDLYGKAFGKAVDEVLEGSEVGDSIILNGKPYVMALYGAGRDDTGKSYYLIGIRDGKVDTFTTVRSMIIAGIIFLLFFSIGLGIVAYTYTVGLSTLAKAMRRVARGDGKFKVVSHHAEFLTPHWDALAEINKRFDNMNYSMYKTYQAYYRFAPKNIEALLHKDSISEVGSGDNIIFNGTMSIITFAEGFALRGDGMTRLNEILTVMEKHQKINDGIVVSSDLGSSVLKLVFVQKRKSVCNFGIDFLHEIQTKWSSNSNAAVILHYTEFNYGVVGNEEQSMVFLESTETAVLERYSKWLLSLGVSLAVTGKVKERENIPGELRYIGYLREGTVKLELYEVIDANIERVRHLKLKNLQRYNEALDLFLKNDFYLARNIFSEIYREMPEDMVTKWYLFECEKHLNAEATGEIGRLYFDS
ncbi:MAG: hypothetical protein K6F00_11595, partial [Lachnospiraceae bacterium]|nr:hypothetical protein [Lachnospiraceae bacterium]